MSEIVVTEPTRVVTETVTVTNGVPTDEIRVPAALLRAIRMSLGSWDRRPVPPAPLMHLAIDQLALRDALNDVLLQRERDVR